MLRLIASMCGNQADILSSRSAGVTDASQVLHGAGNDVLWLQRDFRIYIVNAIDTAVCCQVLSAICSLALFDPYCRNHC